MATYIIGLILLIMLAFACRHIWHNFSSGKHDCCGTGGDSCGGCCNCKK
ncbi:MAG: FeoB-associated Cys-rich membrane protein [Anaerovibrio sp.]|nr:FeoB-associated Cys-rich membrane protein [Anaerovibrio sp.]MCR5175774.1 FeoB-associated Cys-rich membrane protein [Anaerovibrio sp.]